MTEPPITADAPALVVHTSKFGPAPGDAPPAKERPSRAVLAALWLLDVAPFPLGEWACGALFLLRNVVRPAVAARAWRWLARYPSPQPLFLRTCQLFLYQGRFRARHSLIGLASPDALAARVRIDGREHLPEVGAILLGFHVGPPVAGEALCASGIPVLSVAGQRYSRQWTNEAWAPVRRLSEAFALTEDPSVLGGALYRMRRRLAGGEHVYVMGDGLKGRVAFTLQVHDVRVLKMKSSWLLLAKHTGARVVPVTTHYEGPIQVVTLHPPLPPFDPARIEDLVQCQALLQALLERHAAAHPEQCSGFVYSY